MKIDCSEHRKTMELLSLKIQLEKDVQEGEKLDEIRKRIEELQKELGLD